MTQMITEANAPRTLPAITAGVILRWESEEEVCREEGLLRVVVVILVFVTVTVAVIMPRVLVGLTVTSSTIVAAAAMVACRSVLRSSHTTSVYTKRRLLDEGQYADQLGVQTD